MRMISRWISIAVGMMLAPAAWAAEFTATVDREEIALDESVSLKLTIEAEGSVPMEEPEYQAPDFETIHQYQSQFVESTFINGKVGARFTRSFTYVLRPNSTGKKTISGIKIKVQDQTLQANPLVVQVGSGGAGTPPSKHAGTRGNGLRGAGKAPRGEDLFVRAEVDKSEVFKGEQVMVSYYLFVRSQSYNAQAEKFPALNGFLKEEVEVPLIRGQMQEEVVTVDGGVYKKIMIARYAAYPLKAGKLFIDPMVLKVNHYSARMGMDDDAEDLFNQFFRQLTPKTDTIRSESIPIQVQALPESGKPGDFSGAVGDFSVVSAVNRYEARVNEPINLTVKIEGRGNLSIVEASKLDLPDGLQLYESRSQTKEGRGGTGERIFEYLLIPRKEGSFTVPGIRFSYFDPRAKDYVSKTTESITLKALPGDPSLAPAGAPRFPVTPGGVGFPDPAARPEVPRPSAGETPPPSKLELGTSLEGWTGNRSGIETLSQVLLVLLAVLTLGVSIYLTVPWVKKIWLRSREERKKDNESAKKWAKLRGAAQGALHKPFPEVVRTYEMLESQIQDMLEERYRIAVKALSRDDLRDLLVREKEMPEDLWDQLQNLFDFIDTVRFAHRAGAVSEDRIRNELPNWIQKAEAWDKSLQKKSL